MENKIPERGIIPAVTATVFEPLGDLTRSILNFEKISGGYDV
nr:MAG TPA: hypothetical protein [Bacteriophage sp.]